MEEIVFIWRGIERLMIVGVGGLSIILGYRLFLKIPEIRDSAGKVDLPGGASVMLSRIGPGVFFALFGASVISIALYVQAVKTAPLPPQKQTEAMLDTPSGDLSAPLVGLSYSTGIVTLQDKENAITERTTAIGDIRVLNDLQKTLEGCIKEGCQGIPLHVAHRAAGMIQRVKRTVIYSVWDDRWGDYEIFVRWVNKGAADPFPPEALGAAKLFTEGELMPSTP